MDSTLRELLQQIVTHPAEDSIRLMYADRCDELGEHDRAEFIRVQCELVKHPLRHVLNVDSLFIRKGLLHFYSQHERRVSRGRYDLKILDADKGERTYYDNVLVGRISADGNGVATIDEHSIPVPDRIKELRQRERELFQQSEETHKWFGDALHLTRLGDDWYKYLQWFSRGFISSITCTAEDFLKHADQLIWNEEMKDKIKCGQCDGEGEVRPCGLTNYYRECSQCIKDYFCIPRPMPITAQPIEKVKLTTLDRESMKRLEINMLIDDINSNKPRWRGDRYKNIEFELPDLGEQLATY